jgi:hypothetical protein
MNEQEARELVGDDGWDDFLDWLAGQTIGINDDGTIDYYDSDVKRYCERRRRER